MSEPNERFSMLDLEDFAKGVVNGILLLRQDLVTSLIGGVPHTPGMVDSIEISAVAAE